jgi:hypothetical protein
LHRKASLTKVFSLAQKLSALEKEELHAKKCIEKLVEEKENLEKRLVEIEAEKA